MKFRWLLILFSFFITGMTAQAQSIPTLTLTPTPETSVVIAPDVFVRGGPGRRYPAVGRLVEGQLLTPVSRNAAGDWVLIRYYRSFGWIQRDLAFWREDIMALPEIGPVLTPSPIPGRVSATPFFPTFTPTGNWVWTDARSVYVRGGPGRTYLRLGDLFPGDVVEPVSRNEDTTWILIRFHDGFGWI
ncbi:MAG TPA: hypothetical protein VHO69_11120, partial [Phototrophicaceae bacterium]|nr:hypothetical protein [Phototrophicaceae bacterium]